MTNQLIIIIAQYAVFLLPIIAGVIFFRLPVDERKKYFATLALGGVCAFLLAKLGSHFFFDPRPFVAGHITPLFPHIPDNGFPSDHTTFGATFAFVGFFYARRWGLVMMPIAVAVGVARVLTHVHSWIDIIGGVAVGLCATVIALSITRYVVKQVSARQYEGGLHAR